MSTLGRAIAIAATAHEGQVDKAGAPYILHPLRVLHRLDTTDERIVAVLHDVIEDTPVTLDELRAEGFSDSIIDAIDAVTKRPDEDYMDFVARAAANPLGRKVKLADLEDNRDLSRISTPTADDYARIEKYDRAIEKLSSFQVLKLSS
jgi:(p)ppGpp synthase/HD superfamily hydrolase